VVHEVALSNVSVDEQMSLSWIPPRSAGRRRSSRWSPHMTEKVRIIVTVIALLELTKNQGHRPRAARPGRDDIAIRLAAGMSTEEPGESAPEHSPGTREIIEALLFCHG